MRLALYKYHQIYYFGYIFIEYDETILKYNFLSTYYFLLNWIDLHHYHFKITVSC